MKQSQLFTRRWLTPALPRIVAPTLTVLTAGAAAPVAYDDVIASKADTQIVLDYLLLNDTDADGNTLSISAVGTPAHGTLTALGGNSYRYTPTTGYSGRDSFTYTVADGTGGTDTGLVTVSVNAAYDIEAARTAILAGVTQIADPTQPGYMALWGPTAASISNYPGQGENRSMIATATLGAGRVVAMPDHQWWVMNSYGGLFNTGTFYENAITWAAGTASKSVPIVTIDSNVATWLTARGYTAVTTTNAAGLPAALASADVCIPGWLGSNPSAALMTAVTDFASAGNALLICDYSPGYSWWWNKSKWDIPGSKILREAGIGFAEDGYEGAPFTINRANDQLTLDTLIAILNNPAGYSQNMKDLAAGTLTQLSQGLGPNDIAYARLMACFNNVIGTITPTPTTPVTDSIQRALLDFECNKLAKLAPASMTAHRAALPVAAAAPRVTNSSFALSPPPAAHYTKTIYTPYYAAPGELVTITFPAALTSLNLDVRVSHLRSGSGAGSYPVMPSQVINFDVTTTSVQVANPHGGLIQIIVPDNVTWTGSQNITVTGAVQAPYFKLGETTDAQWVAGIRDRGTPFGVIDAPEATLVVDADKWLRTLPDPEAVITEWNYFCGKVREFYAYNPGRQLPMHHDYYPAGGVSTYPQSYGLGDEITNSLELKATAYSLTLHEYGHICDSNNLLFDEFGETSPNIGGKWMQETSRKYSWKQELTVGRINNYLSIAGEDLWHQYAHYSVDRKGTLFDLLSAEFGPAILKDSVAAMTAMSAISTSQGKIDEWARQLSNRSGYDLSAFFASWQLPLSTAAQTELSVLPDWMPVERVPESLTLVQNGSATFVNPSSNDFSYDGGLTLTAVNQPAHGTVTNNGNGTYTYTPTAGYTGSDSFTYSVTNTTGNVFTSTIPVKVVAAAGDPKLAAFDGVANGSGWTTVTLDKSYTSMVVIAQPLGGAGAPPLASRIQNASGSSFQVRLDRLDGSSTPVGPTGVRYLVVEAGVYNEATHGIKMEAVKFTSSTTDRAGAFTGTTRSYAYTGYDHYFIPTVFGQVMTSNDSAWSSFWYDPNANNLRVGKHVGEDPDTTRSDETIGYIVMEAGSYQFGNYQIQAGLSDYDAYEGFGLIGEGGGSHSFTRFPTIHSAQMSAGVGVPWGASDPGLDGFVTMQAVAAGNTLSGYLTEDSLGDAERSTGTKSVAYLLAHRTGGAPYAKPDQVRAIAGQQTLIKVLDNDETPGSPALGVTQPANGTVTIHSDGTLIYTPTIGYTGPDAFTYTLTGGSGSAVAPVSVQVIAASAVQAGIKADRFNGISGGSLANLTGSANYPNSPSTSTIWTTANSGQNVGDNLGHRIYGVIVPPTTGDYTFWIASDDASQLSLGTDSDPATASVIASVSGYTGYQAWDQTGSQKSAVKTLTAGKAYYLEALHKEGGGGDHVSIAWQGPGITRTLLATPALYTAGENAPTLVAAPSNVSRNEGAAPTVVDLSSVFSSSDPGDPLTLAVHGNSRPDLVSTSLSGNLLTISSVGMETGTATLTIRATDRTNTLVTTSFTVTLVDSIPDSDSDGLVDSWEVTHFGNLSAQSGTGDPDGDGLSNAGELSAGTNPQDADSDDDGYRDQLETLAGSNPNSGSSTPQGTYAGLASWWRLDETSGSAASDAANAHNGTVSGATWGTGKSGNALTFDGVDDGLLVGNSAAVTGTGDFSLGAWVKVNPGSPLGTVIQQREPGGTGYIGEHMLNVNANGTVNFFVYGSGGYQFNLTTTATVNNGQWHHISAVRSGTNGYLYIDGVQAASGSGTVQSMNSLAVSIGYDYRDNNKRFTGSIDDVRVYSRAISAGEALYLYDPLSLPLGWTKQDIGSVGVAGSATHTAGSYTLNGSGADIWGTADAFHYAWQTLSGDGEITARVASVENTNAWAKAGVMIRESLTAGSAHASIFVSPSSGVSFQRRTATSGTSTSTTTTGITAPRWVKIVRSGNVLTTSHSANGTSWTTLGSETISMASTIYIGLAVTSHANTTDCTAVFDNVSVTP